MARTGDRGGADTRARIAASASRLFLDRGFDDVTVAEVARDAGVSSVTVFKHFPRKEDLFLDRAEDAAELLRAAAADADPVTALERALGRLLGERHPLSGLDERSLPFFRIVAGSPALVARARELAAGLQARFAAALEASGSSGDPDLLAAFFVGGYAAALTATAASLLSGAPAQTAEEQQRARVERLFEALRGGLPAA